MQRKNNKENKEFLSKDWGKYNIGIVVSDFNSDITSKLLDGALEFLIKTGFKKENIKVVHAPGSFEIPLICQNLARSKKFDGLVAIGAVIKGDTDHHYYIAGEAARGIMDVMLQESIPIAFGVLTTLTLKQAQDRSGKSGNKGAEAAEALLMTLESLAK